MSARDDALESDVAAGRPPGPVDAAGRLPESVDAVGRLPESVDAAGRLPESVDAAGRLPGLTVRAIRTGRAELPNRAEPPEPRELSNLPDLPEPPKLSKLPDGPDLPDLSELPDGPDLPELPDLLELDLADLRTIQHPVLTEVLEELRERAGRPSEMLWGFNNAF